MAFFVPLLAGIGGGLAASALGAGTLGAIGTGVVTAAATGSLMSKGKSSAAAPAPAPAPKVVTETKPTVPKPPPAPVNPKKPAPKKTAVQTAEETSKKGRQATILTKPQGLLAGEEAPGLLRERRSLMGGLIR
ncbi:MAG: hypothetical protein ABF313_04470 [Marivita sp.]